MGRPKLLLTPTQATLKPRSGHAFLSFFRWSGSSERNELRLKSTPSNSSCAQTSMNLRSSICPVANSDLKLRERQHRRIMEHSSPTPPAATGKCVHSRERPQAQGSLTQNPTPILGGEESDLIAVQRQRLGVATVGLDARPIAAPHQPLRPKGVVDPLNPVVRVLVWVLLVG